uniref:PAP-associated domain-containing protein n=1 Tax=Glossina austeni TaxID=7395 RepID=A0A1A9UME1_GLOAU
MDDQTRSPRLVEEVEDIQTDDQTRSPCIGRQVHKRVRSPDIFAEDEDGPLTSHNASLREKLKAMEAQNEELQRRLAAYESGSRKRKTKATASQICRKQMGLQTLVDNIDNCVLHEFYYSIHRIQEFVTLSRETKRLLAAFKWLDLLVSDYRLQSNFLLSKHFLDVLAIRSARVPIIKCKYKETGFSVDINLSCLSSVDSTPFLQALVEADVRIHSMLLFLKIWAKHMQIVKYGNMSSYCLIILAIFYLQQPLENYNNLTILLPIKKLQANCNEHLVQGVNYAFELESNENKPCLPPGGGGVNMNGVNMNGLKGSDVEKLQRPKHNKKLNRYKAALKFLNTPEKLKERSRIHESLKNCKPGEELQSIFKILSVDHERLELIFIRIRSYLAKKLKILADQLKIFAFGSIATNLALRDKE